MENAEFEKHCSVYFSIQFVFFIYSWCNTTFVTLCFI